MWTDTVAYIAGVCLALSFIPQVIKTFQTKRADDVSMGMLLLSLGSAGGYQYYAWVLELVPVFIMNSIFLMLLLTEIVLKLRYDKLAVAVRQGSPEPPE